MGHINGEEESTHFQYPIMIEAWNSMCSFVQCSVHQRRNNRELQLYLNMSSQGAGSKYSKEHKAETVAALYHYSDLSVEAIARQVDLDKRTAQRIVDNLAKEEAMKAFADLGTTPVEKIMTTDTAVMEGLKTIHDAARLMAKREIGSIIVTRNGKLFGIVTERDIIRKVGVRDAPLWNVKLEDIASHPLIVAEPSMTAEQAGETMTKNKIRKLPVVKEGNLLGIVTITDLAMFLSPSRRPGLALSVLQAIARGKKR